jgi:ABC-type bacteriocin/lantibiotic exporter with double-glycine peptidase domain
VVSLALAAWLAGCGHARAPALARAPDQSDWVVVPGVPVVSQKGQDDCGRAALAMALARWGQQIARGDVTPKPGEGGVSAGALRDEARRRGFSAYVFEGHFEDLAVEIASGRPVVIGLVRVDGPRRLTHFAVIAGHEAGGGRWLMVDPTLGVRSVSGDTLRTEWARSGFVTLVIDRAAT